MEAIAKLKNSPYPPRKMRLLADIVRGLPVEKALHILKLHKKKMHAEHMYKLLLSATANWKQLNEDADLDEANLIVKTIQVDGARFLKRIQPAPQGRAHRIQKRFSHVTITVADANAKQAEVNNNIEETAEVN